MKRVRTLIQISVFILVISFAGICFAGIASTVHNMSASGPGTVKAQSAGQPAAVQGAEQEICVFCHTPHSATNIGYGAPLWNRNIPAASGYVMYKSDYLYRSGYAGSGADYDPTTAQPGLMSLVCLSCHDGTIAVGGIYAYKNSVLGGTLIQMQGVSGSGMMLNTNGDLIGTDLSNHHPVGIQYDSNITFNFGSGTRTIELATPGASPPLYVAPPVLNPETSPSVVLWNESGATYVECSSCHDPHVQGAQGKFLRVNTGTLAGDINTTCTSCHNKTGWTGSVHQSNTTAYSAASGVSTAFGANTVAALSCRNCHMPHFAIGSYLNTQIEEQTCFQGASSTTSETACHGSSSTGKNIQSVLGRAVAHPVTTISGIHTDLDVLFPAGGPTGASTHGLEWINNDMHAECTDCHNPHQAMQGNHATPVGPNGWYPSAPSSATNLVSGALTGVPGVDISGAQGLWTVPTSFTTLDAAAKEYQICFKCHTYYGMRAPSGISSTMTHEGTNFTDQGLEFSTANRSVHPVVLSLNNQPGEYYHGSGNTDGLATGVMQAPWDANTGNQTMYCSDCHGADNENAGDPRGPHGSSYNFMLKGTGKYWPTDASGNLYVTQTASGGKIPNANGCFTFSVPAGTTCVAQDQNLFCNNCHSFSGDSPHNKTNSTSLPCISCHPVIPHGWINSRLLVFHGESVNPTYSNYVSGVYHPLNGVTKPTNGGTFQTGNCWTNDSTNCSNHYSATNPGVTESDP